MVQVEAWSASPFSGLLISEHDGARRGRLSPTARLQRRSTIKIVVHRLRRRVVASTTEGKET